MTIRQLERFGIDHLHYMAPLPNAAFIVATGIFCYNEARAFSHLDVSHHHVQRRRNRAVPGTSRRIHDFVPLYFATHTPMQYVLTLGSQRTPPRLTQRELVILEVDAERVFSRSGVIFTDGNAAATETQFYSALRDLAKLDWEIIDNPVCYSREYKRKKAAEVLVPDYLPADWITRVVVNDSTAKDHLDARVQKIRDVLPDVAPDFSCEHLDDFSCTIDATHF